MKITIWIRSDEEGRKMTLRTDYKQEKYDTPQVCRYARKIIAALDGEDPTSDTGKH